MTTIETFDTITDEYLEKKRRRGRVLLSLAEAHRDGMVEGCEDAAEYLSARVATRFVHIDNVGGLRAALARHEPDPAAQEAKDGPTLMHHRAVVSEVVQLLAVSLDYLKHTPAAKDPMKDLVDAHDSLNALLGETT